VTLASRVVPDIDGDREGRHESGAFLLGTIDEAQRATRRRPSDDQGKITTALDEFKEIASKIKSEWLAPWTTMLLLLLQQSLIEHEWLS
jgi:hypothetical protein